MPVAKLDNAPRCQHTKMNGQPCAAPARRGRKYCVFHEAAHAKRPDQTVRLVEDAMSLQFALFQVMRSLDDHSIDPKRAALKLYALQIASSNLKRLQQEIDYVPSADPARQQSLLELLLDQFQIPREEWDRADTPVEEPRLIQDEQNPTPPPTFTIEGCAAEKTLAQPRAAGRFTINACADPCAHSRMCVTRRKRVGIAKLVICGVINSYGCSRRLGHHGSRHEPLCTVLPEQVSESIGVSRGQLARQTRRPDPLLRQPARRDHSVVGDAT